MRSSRKGASHASAQQGGWLVFQPLSKRLFCSSESGEESQPASAGGPKLRVVPTLSPTHSNPCIVCWTFILAIAVPLRGKRLPAGRAARSTLAVKSAKPVRFNNANAVNRAPDRQESFFAKS